MSSFTNAHTKLRLALAFDQAMIVTEPFTYYVGDKDNPNMIITVPEGFYSDGISSFWKFSNRWTGIQKWGPYAAAGVLHDFLYAEHRELNIKRKQADKIFRQACIVLGCPHWRAQAATSLLYAVGWGPWMIHNFKRNRGLAQAWDLHHVKMLYKKKGFSLCKLTQREFNRMKVDERDHA